METRGKPKGLPKSGGKKKGSPNKLIAAIEEDKREVVADKALGALFQCLETINDDISKLEPKDRVSTGLKLMEFFMAKLKATEQTTKLSVEGGQVFKIGNVEVSF